MADNPKEGGRSVFPVYFVVDTGESISDNQMLIMNNALDRFLEEISCDPMTDARTRVSLISYSDSAAVIFSQFQIGNQLAIVPKLESGGKSDIGQAFRAVKSHIEADVRILLESFSVYRPLVILVCGGSPASLNWQQDLHKLVDPGFKFRPNIVSVAWPGTSGEILGELSRSAPLGIHGFFTLAAGDTDARWLYELFWVMSPFDWAAKWSYEESNTTRGQLDQYAIDRLKTWLEFHAVGHDEDPGAA